MESEFMKLLRKATRSDIEILAKLISPYIADLDMRQIKVWGDRSRLDMTRATIPVNDLFVNTRSGNVKIDEDCFFGHRCMLLTGTHDYRKIGMERLRAVPECGRDIHVKRGVWMGTGVMVLGPAVIGENSVVAAGSLVIGNLPDNVIAAGRPAKVVKSIFD